jgi:hypothetical protein
MHHKVYLLVVCPHDTRAGSEAEFSQVAMNESIHIISDLFGCGAAFECSHAGLWIVDAQIREYLD